ncbi:MAG TPA: hypothetical protein VKR06_38625 [Ktedonosporobacter sp.]|nr:hypothetical protein [Ktedonosporobacter sp.]
MASPRVSSSSSPSRASTLHLHWPEDIDALCRSMIAEGLQVPACTHGLLEEDLWSDGISAWIYRLSQALPLVLAQTSDEPIRRIARRWDSSFPSENNEAYKDLLYQNGVQALFDLREVAQYALERNVPLLLLLLR